MREDKHENRIEKQQETATHQYLRQDIAAAPITQEVSGDYTLPDYQPEIRRILSVRTAVLPSGQYRGNTRVELAGTVACSVLYADAEGKAASVTLPLEYEFSVPLPDDAPTDVLCDSMVENTTCRPGGPRKLTLRTRLRHRVHLLREEDVAPVIRGMGAPADEDSLEILRAPIKTMALCGAASAPLSLSDTVHLEESGDTLHVVWCGGEVLINECRMQEGGCLCRGEVWVRALCAPATGTPYIVRTKIPLEEQVPIEHMEPGATCTACGRVTGVDVSITPGEEQAPGTMHFTITAELDAYAAGNRTLQVVRALYSTAYEMNDRYIDRPVCRHMGSCMGHYTVSGSREREECDAAGAMTVVDADGHLEITQVAVERGRAVISGQVHAQMIYAEAPEGETLTGALGAADIPLPFRVETDLAIPAGEAPSFECHGTCVSVRGRLEPTALAVDAEIALTLRATATETVHMLAEAEPDRSLPVERGGNRVIVYYPQEGDDLFSVCARYHKKCAAVCQANGLGEGNEAGNAISLDGVHHLLIEN